MNNKSTKKSQEWMNVKILIDGVEHYHIKVFSALTGKSVETLRYTFMHGNRIRKLKGKYIAGKIYIEACELHEFPFITGGHGFKHKVYFVNDDLDLEYTADYDADKGKLIMH